MEDRLRAYVDGLFRGAPESPQMNETKEEILQNTIDKYHDLINEGKSEEAAYRIAIDGIGDLDEIFNSGGINTGGNDSGSGDSDGAKPYNTNTGCNGFDGGEYEKRKRTSAVLTAIAVMLYILCVIPPVIFSEIGLDTIGVVLMFIFIAAATGILIINSMTKPKGMDGKEYRQNGSYDGNGDGYGGNDGRENNGRENDGGFNVQTWKSIKCAIWCMAIVLYFLIGFTVGAWHLTWLIFPATVAVQSVVRACMVNGKFEPNARMIGVICSVACVIALITLAVIFIIRSAYGCIPVSCGIGMGSYYDNADKYKAGNMSYTPDTGTGNPLSELHINWEAGEVLIVSKEGLDTIEIVEKSTGRLSEKDSVHSYYHDGILEIQYCRSGKDYRGFGFLKGGSKDKTLEISIPERLSCDIKDIEGDFVSADVRMHGLKTENLDIETVSGNVDFSGEAHREIDIESVSADINLELAKSPGALDAETVSGDVTVILPSTETFTADMDSVSGKLSCDMPDMHEHPHDDYKHIQCGGDSGGKFDFESVSGDVHIKKAR